jgi:hypothetical protein
MRFSTAFFFCCLAAGCAGNTLAPEAIRQADFTEKIAVKRGTAYRLALHWFDKNLRVVPGAVQIQEPDTGRIRTQAALKCNSLRKENDLKDYFLTFELDFEAQPQLMSFHFTQLRMENGEGQLVPWAEAQLSDAQNVGRIHPCLKKVVEALAKAVESTTPTW